MLGIFLLFFGGLVAGSIFRSTKDHRQASNSGDMKVNPAQSADIVNSVKACVDAKLLNRKFKKETQKTKYMMMSAHSLEAINGLSSFQIRQVQFLTECVQKQAPQLFLNSESSADVYYGYGGSNVTFLTGILPRVFPDLHQKLLSGLKNGLQSSFWKHLKQYSNRNFGIRSIYVISGERPGYNLFMHLIQARKNGMLPSLPVIPSDMPESEAALYHRFHQYLHLKGADRSNHRSNFVSDHYGTDFTLYGALTDFYDSCNADYLLRRHATEEDIEMEKNDEYEDLESISEPQEYEHLDLLHKNNNLKPNDSDENKEMQNANFFDESYENYTPERGNLLLIRGNSHGPNELLCGKRQSLIVEYWSYNDAPMQSGVASLAQGQDELGLITQPDDHRDYL